MTVYFDPWSSIWLKRPFTLTHGHFCRNNGHFGGNNGHFCDNNGHQNGHFEKIFLKNFESVNYPSWQSDFEKKIIFWLTFAVPETSFTKFLSFLSQFLKITGVGMIFSLMAVTDNFVVTNFTTELCLCHEIVFITLNREK